MTDEGNDVDLTPEERAEVDGMFLKLANADYYELLGVAPDADRKTIRDGYFSLSQRFHPDAWFGRKTGPWKARMEAIFRDVTKAYDVLSNRNARAAYDATRGVNTTAVTAKHVVPREIAEAVRATTSSPTPSSTTAPPSRPSSAGMHAAPQPAPLAPAHIATPAPAQFTRGTSHNDPIIPDRSQPRAPTHQTSPAVSVAPPLVDHEAARRAAREALARKMGVGSAGTTGRYPTMPRSPEPGGPPRQTISGTTISSSTLASLQYARSSRLDAERTAKLEHYLRLADESAARKDLLGESNALQLALMICPDDATLRTRAEETGRRSSEALAEKYIELAKQAESQSRWDAAADNWQRAVVGRPRDAGVLLRAANAMLRAGKEPQKAAELAKRSVQAAPRVDGYALLAEIYLSVRMKASALAAIESAAKLDPHSPIVKDLLARARA